MERWLPEGYTTFEIPPKFYLRENRLDEPEILVQPKAPCSDRIPIVIKTSLENAQQRVMIKGSKFLGNYATLTGRASLPVKSE